MQVIFGTAGPVQDRSDNADGRSDRVASDLAVPSASFNDRRRYVQFTTEPYECLGCNRQKQAALTGLH